MTRCTGGPGVSFEGMVEQCFPESFPFVPTQKKGFWLAPAGSKKKKMKLKHLKNYLKFKVKVFSHFFICPLLGFDQLLRRFDKFLPGL